MFNKTTNIIIGILIAVACVVIGLTILDAVQDNIFWHENNAVKVYIVDTPVGYDIYSADRELLLEFIGLDTFDLQTLEYIYDTAKEFE